MILAKNCRRMTGIGARFRQRVGQPLEPPIPLYPVVPPLPDEDDNELDMEVEQNNPPGSMAEIDDTAVFFDALAALLDIDDSIVAGSNDATLTASLGPSIAVVDVEPAATPTGVSAGGNGAPPAFDASLRVADTGPFFQPLERELRMSFLPTLLGIPLTKIDGGYRQLLTQGVKQGGLAIRNPVDTAPSIHAASLAATRYLTVSLVSGDTRGFDLGAHQTCATEAEQVARKSRLIDEQLSLMSRAGITPQ